MAKYFTIMHGLRGCYMPDSTPYVVMARTRRELKMAIEYEASMLGDMVGLSKRAIASFAAVCWREAHEKTPAYLPHCLPCREERQSSYSYGIFASVATRAEYVECQKDQDR